MEAVNKTMAENKRKAQLSIDDSSRRHRMVANTTGTSDGSIPVTINVPTIQGIDTDREASGTRFIVYSRCNTNGTGTIDTMTSSEILSGIHKNKWERSNTMPYNYLVKVLDDIKNNVLVGKIGGEVCSMLSFRFIGRGQKDTTISLVWTSESHRKKGYSTQLLRTAVPWLLDNSFLHSGSTSMDGQHMCRSQNWDEAFVNSFSTEVKKLRKNLEEKLRQKSTGSNNNWEITIDHNDILAVYTLPQQNSSSETTNEVTSTSQLSRRSGRRKCTREPLNIGHSVSTQKQTYGNDYAEKESALKRQDPNEKNGRDLWLLSKNSKMLPFLTKINGRIENWIFYPSKHECRTLSELIARGGIQGEHYADGFPELGEIVTKYGKDVADWPNLLVPQVEQSEHETNGNVQNPTTATSAAARHSPGSGIASMRASNTTNRVSLSPDQTRTAPIETKSEQNREATDTTRVQKLERVYYGGEKNNYALFKRLIDLEVDVLGSKKIGGFEARIQALEQRL